MTTRRFLLTQATGLAVLAVAGRAAAQAADGPSKFIGTLLQQIATIVNGDAPLGQRQEALQRVVDNNVDVSEVARFCLGRFWRTATPAQQHDYLELFHRVLVNNVTGHVASYRGVSFSVGQSVERDGTFNVPTTVVRPGNQPNKVVWMVTMAEGPPKVVDLISEGVSLRLTQRSDYAAYLARNNNNVQALIDALRQQASNQQS